TRQWRTLPTSAEGFVDGDQARCGIGARLREAILVHELCALGVEHFEEVGRSTLVARARNTCGRLAGGRRRRGITQAVTSARVRAERVLGLFQRPQHGRLVPRERCVGAGTAAGHLGPHAPEIECCPGYPRPYGVAAARRGTELARRGSGVTEAAGESHFGKEIGD